MSFIRELRAIETTPTVLGLDRAFFDPALLVLSIVYLLSGILTVVFLDEPFKWKKQPPDFVQFLCIALVAASCAYALTDEWEGAAVAAGLGLAGMLILDFCLPRLTAQAIMQMATPIALLPMNVPWGYLWFKEMGMPDWMITLYLAGNAIGFLFLPLSFIMSLPDQAMFSHRKFVRPNAPLPPRRSGPKVSLHFCCYAEPPDMVIESLRALMRMDYDNYEVIVCDNNTKDPALWMPVREECEKMNAESGNELFKFYHVDEMKGAKAGALNYCLTKTDPEAKFVGLLDADYQANPDFISALVGFFDDEKIGYVQTPHYYRDINESLFKKICFWNYIKGYKVLFPSHSEYAMCITVGTMCIYRRTAIELAGGWAEWCLVEDSEMSIRIHHQGFDGIFLNKVFGEGLIPECFPDLRKQWFRWTAGPVKTMIHHIRMYALAILQPSSTKMHIWQKILLYKQGVSTMIKPLGMVLTPFFAAVSALLIHFEVLPAVNLPVALWQALLIGAPTRILSQWPFYKLAGATSIKDMVYGAIGVAALDGVRIEAVLIALFTRNELPWVRTPKFEAYEAHYWRAIIHSAPLETSLTLLCLALSIGFVYLKGILGDIALMFNFLFATMALTFMCSIFLVVTGEAAKAKKGRVLETKPTSQGSIHTSDVESAQTSFESSSQILEPFRGTLPLEEGSDTDQPPLALRSPPSS